MVSSELLVSSTLQLTFLEALYFTKWIHCIETETSNVPLTSQEQEIIDSVRNILLDVEGDWDGTRPMTPDICRLWAGMYDETWVWEGTLHIFEKLYRMN